MYMFEVTSQSAMQNQNSQNENDISRVKSFQLNSK